MGRLVGLCVIALACACYDPPSDNCAIQCTPGAVNACPDGLACNSAGLCSIDGASCTGPSIDFAQIGVGSRHACGLATNGDIYCWGANELGQLGDGTSGEPRPLPAKVMGGPYSNLTVGSEHTCAMQNGAVMCWGDNDEGQVRGAMGSTFAMPTAVLAGSAPPFEKLSAGGWHTCGIASGQLWCWGYRDFTNGTAQSTATRVGTRDDWRHVSAGYDHACAISDGAGVQCFGENDRGQLGDGTLTPSSTPQTPSNLPSALVPIAVTAGDELTCTIFGANATAAMGELWCWGINSSDQSIIDGSGFDRHTPYRVGMDADWTTIALGRQIACGNRNNRTYCWGTSYDGGIGNGLWNQVRLTIDNAVEVGTFEQLALQLSSHDGDDVDIGCGRSGTDVFCWGNDSYGQLAQGKVSRHAKPVEIAAPSGTWASAVAGHYHTCAITDGGAPYCWGATTLGAVHAGISLGYNAPCVAGEVCDIPTPTAAPSPVTRADEIVAGDHYTCMRNGGTVQCWGSGYRGVLGASGSGASVRSVTAPNAATWTKIMGGEAGNCGKTSANELACWGFIAGIERQTPTVYTDAALQDLATINFGEGYGCGATITSKARVCWGGNTYGELGIGNTTPIGAPETRDEGTIEHIAAHDHLTCAATTTGGVKCWGSNDYNEAGDPTRLQHQVLPNDILSAAGPLTGCTKVSIADAFGCALCSGRVWCWGRNYAGELGRAALSYGQPTHLADQVSLPAELTFVDVSVGRYHGCARTESGRLFCWGNGVHGQIGDGGQSRNVPTQIAP